MEYFIIKKEDESANSCPYYYDEQSWGADLMQAKQFGDAVDAEYTRKRLNNPNKARTFIAQVSLVESEVSLSVEAKPIPRSTEVFRG